MPTGHAPRAARKRLISFGGTSLVAASLLMLAMAGPAAARPVDKGTYSFTDSGIECGKYIRETTVSGRFVIKDATPATNGQFFYFQQWQHAIDVITNPDTGAFFTVSADTLFREGHARLLEDGTFTYTTKEIGQPFVIRDMTGKVVLRDVGLIEFSYLFDSRGDSAPGGDILSEELVRVSGPHPGFADTFDFCGLADQLIG